MIKAADDGSDKLLAIVEIIEAERAIFQEDEQFSLFARKLLKEENIELVFQVMVLVLPEVIQLRVVF